MIVKEFASKVVKLFSHKLSLPTDFKLQFEDSGKLRTLAIMLNNMATFEGDYKQQCCQLLIDRLIRFLNSYYRPNDNFIKKFTYVGLPYPYPINIYTNFDGTRFKLKCTESPLWKLEPMKWDTLTYNTPSLPESNLSVFGQSSEHPNLYQGTIFISVTGIPLQYVYTPYDLKHRPDLTKKHGKGTGSGIYKDR